MTVVFAQALAFRTIIVCGPMGDRPERDVLESTADAILGAPPAIDRAAMERARARAETAIFGTSEPGRIGRFEIIDRIGDGGMGLVYSAYDPRLQRRVALKILHPRRNHEARSHQRMITEARALAKLDHPNVVKVHDVIVEDDQVVLIMELLEGETLLAWQTRQRRPWREIVDAYAQAGEGLAAAHGVEVVHRDFKPTNAIIGADGRVHVVDFGLARVSAADAAAGAESGAAVAAETTGTGDVIGTLAYSPPEQLAGALATASSDQFSLCVALHAAVEGVAPFVGTDAASRRASIEAGSPRRATDGRRTPPWLRATIARGLAASPGARFPSMRELVHELRRPRGWRRWRLPALVATVTVAAVAGTALVAASRDARDACGGGAELVQIAWSTARRDQVRRAIDTVGTPYAHDVRDHALSTMDEHASQWRDVHMRACRAHRHGDLSDPLFDREMTCLARRLGDLRAATDVLATVDAGSLANVMDVATAVPPASECSDLARLTNEAQPPTTPQLRAQVEPLQAAISAAEALARAGRSEQALSQLAALRAQAKRIEYPPVQVDAALAEGRIRLVQHDLAGAIEALAIARDLAFEQQMLPQALEAAARILFAEGTQKPNLDRLQAQMDALLPLSASLRGDRIVRPLLLNNAGVVYLAAGHRAEAASYFEEAAAEMRRRDSQDLELTVVDLNLAMITSDGPKRETLARSVWEKLRDKLGEEHHSALDALVAYAQYVSDPAVALDGLTRAQASYEKFHPGARAQIEVLAAKRAFLTAELGDVPHAITLYRAAIEAMAGDNTNDAMQLRRLCEGELGLLLDDAPAALDAFRPVFEARRTSPNWWEKSDALRAEVGMGQADGRLGHVDAAIERLDAAIQGYPQVLALNEEVEYRRYLARAKHALAQLLAASHREPARAHDLEQEAMSFYRSASPTSYRWLLAKP